MKLVNKAYLFLIMSLYVTALIGAIGCQKFDYTPDYWNVSKPRYTKCSCPCSQVLSDNKGQCTQCGHYGNPERGAITRRVTIGQGLLSN